MLYGYKAAKMYAYSNSRVKAMESKLINDQVMQSIISAKDIPSTLQILFQTDYKDAISDFGGLGIKADLIDFALSKNFAERVSTLVNVTPIIRKKLIRAIIGKWDIYNIRLALEAKEKNQSFDAIARYVIDYGRYNASALKEAMREESIEGLFSRLMINSPYADLLRNALESYRKRKDIIDVLSSLERGYYSVLKSAMMELRGIDYSASILVKKEIDMRNVLLLIRSKTKDARFQDISGYIVDGGSMKLESLQSVYSNSEGVEDLASQISAFDLKGSVEAYKRSEEKHLLLFEIEMRNEIMRTSNRMLKHSVLSFGTMVDYIYLKEIELFTLRVLIKAKVYGLEKDEISRLVVWKID